MPNGRSPHSEQAHIALKNGQRQKAVDLAHQSIREDPNDYHAWLLLCALAPTPAQSREYLERAEMLRPDDPAVQQARAWLAERESKGAKPPAPPPTPTPQRTRRWATAVFLLIAIFTLAGLTAAALLTQQTTLAEVEEPTATPPPPPPTAILAGLNEGTETAVATLPPTYEHAQLGGNPTPTLQPTATATPTIFPTYISPQNGPLPGRPEGVAAGERWINVNLSTQTLTAYEGDQPVFTTAISSGKATHPTVTGLFRVWLRYEKQTMNGYLLGYDYYIENVPYVMYFYRDYALHGAYWHNSFGVPMSHGCVNLSPDDAAWLYQWSSYGTVVYVHS
jgi:lipoprotein-anchoring transpeptidase ErfK/SrfK